MLKFEEIVRAWVTKFNPTEEERALSKKRLEICATCPSRKETLGSNRLFVVCGECGCPLEAKSHSPIKEGACPLGKWDIVDKQN